MTTHLSWERVNDLASREPASPGAVAGVPSSDQLHLAECAMCRDALAEVRALDAAARALPLAVEPPDALWRAVSASIAPPPRRRLAVEVRWLAAAAATLMVVTSAGTWWLATRAQAPAVAAGGRARTAELPVAFVATERAYLDNVAQLQALLDAQRPRLSVATLTVVERALGTIDVAIAEVRDALLADPANQELAELLAASYRQKVELLRRAAEVPGAT